MAKKATRKVTQPFEWKTFLQQVSRDMLQPKCIPAGLPEDVIASQWLGYPGATEQQIATLEKRIRRSLPPSYRSFLKVTNGWRNCGCFIYNLWPCSKVAWFRKRNQDWIDAYVEPWEEAGATDDFSDEEYFVYDDNQDSCKFRMRDLQAALEISDNGDSGILLLNPNVVTSDGEWEAWMFANWLPGAKRYRSFRELMEAQHAKFLTLRINRDAAERQDNQ